MAERLVLIMVLCAALGLGRTANAQVDGDALDPVGPYVEVFLEHPKVAGNLLVGLRWASPPGLFDWTNVRAQVGQPSRTDVCVGIASKDGRYDAENLYDLSKARVTVPLFRAKTKYSNQLRGYLIDDIGVMIRRGSCDDPTSTVIPAIVLPAATLNATPLSRYLVAFVNADPTQLVAELLGGRDGAVIGTCGAAGEGVRIAYSSKCTLGPVEPPGSASVTLRLSIKERYNTIKNDYSLRLTP